MYICDLIESVTLIKLRNIAHDKLLLGREVSEHQVIVVEACWHPLVRLFNSLHCLLSDKVILARGMRSDYSPLDRPLIADFNPVDGC